MKNTQNSYLLVFYSQGPSKEETLKKLRVILDEHLTADTLSECVTAIKELKAPERYLPSMLLHILNHTIDNNGKSKKYFRYENQKSLILLIFVFHF